MTAEQWHVLGALGKAEIEAIGAFLEQKATERRLMVAAGYDPAKTRPETLAFDFGVAAGLLAAAAELRAMRDER